MKDFTKVVRLGTAEGWPIYCKIKFEGGKLSITGVHGPMRNGDAHGSCGQIDMTWRGHEDKITPSQGWDTQRLVRFFNVWDEWHLNDTAAYSPAMLAAGWRDIARKPMLGYEFTLTNDAFLHRRAVEAQVMEFARSGTAVVLDEHDRMLIAVPISYVQWTHEGEPVPEPRPYYQRAKNHYGIGAGNVKSPERKTLGWLYPTEHPEGLLGRKLSDDEPGYGSCWWKHDLPQAEYDFLIGLPDSPVKPAWV